MEKLELVKSFDELRAGLLVVVKCRCGGKHRGITLGPVGYSVWGDAFTMEPKPSCFKSFERFVIPRQSVAAGAVYRVADEEPKQSERTKELELTR